MPINFVCDKILDMGDAMSVEQEVAENAVAKRVLPIGGVEGQPMGYHMTGIPFTMKVWRAETGGPRLRPSTSYAINRENAVNEGSMLRPEEPFNPPSEHSIM